MGYRSKVIIGVKNGELSDEFDNILRKYEFPVDNPDGDYLKIVEDEMKFYTFNYIKWYESDNWCKEIVDFLSKNVYNDFRMKDEDVFCLGLGEDGQIHSEIGEPYEYVEQISEINLID